MFELRHLLRGYIITLSLLSLRHSILFLTFNKLKKLVLVGVPIYVNIKRPDDNPDFFLGHYTDLV